MSLAAIPLVIQVLVAALAGYGVGTVHFRSLAPVTDMMLAGRMLAVVLQLARLAVLTGFLVLAALAGPTPLIAAVISMLVARARVLKAARP